MLLDLNFKQRNVTLLCISLAGIIIALIIGRRPIALSILTAFIYFLLSEKRPTIVYSIVVTLKRDLTAGIRFLRMNLILASWERRQMTVPKIFQLVATKYSNKAAFIMDDRKLTFQDVENISNKIASYFKRHNFHKGDTIALFMENCPEYSPIWLGLSKIGVVTALINSNLRKKTLLHSITVANSKVVIVGSELVSAIQDIRNEAEFKSIPIFIFQDDAESVNLLEGAIDLTKELKEQPFIDISKDIAETHPQDKMTYVYTSGTTGMPKAAVITHLRYMFMAMGANCMLNIKSNEIIYNSLPLYHTAGGTLGCGNVFLRGVTMALRRRFSASNFWTDCIKYEATVAQYIGELCRYLLTLPVKPTDSQHKVRLMFGNGLRPQIWQQFVSRFNIAQIGEVYGSTEGNSNLISCENQVGAIGFVPLIARPLSIYPVTLLKCDEVTGEPYRLDDGRCIRCNAGEPGIFVGKIDPKRAHSSFEGYADKKASEKKILRNVFKQGDTYFNSGDILVMDILGYFYFKDRTGDTFRWRGENVATSEVEAVISNVVGLKDCVVYGVEVPFVEGKAGMAAIVDPENKIDIDALSVGIRGSLPPYARPLFIRELKELPMTGTFKLKKVELQQEGFDLQKVKDPLYLLNNDGIYRRLLAKDFENLKNGSARI